MQLATQQPPFDPFLDVTEGMTDDEMTRRFRIAIKLADEEKIAKGVPVSRYDMTTRRAYLLYADGRREYND